jgi:hypothetical protein
MRGTLHLLLNVIVLGAMALASFMAGWSIQMPLLESLFTIYIFSNLPDIDSSTSGISRSFFIFYAVLTVYGFWTLKSTGILIIIIGLSLALYHWNVRSDSLSHRKFPHSFTFGMMCSAALWYLTSLPVAALGLFCFCLHLLFDMHILRGLSTDVRFWKRIFRIT